jgi:DNA-binding YbaB/EbfC family protein
MFKEIGQLAGLMKNLPRIREEMERFQENLGQLSAEGDAGAGMVRVRVNGRMEVLSCRITEEALKDREMLEDLVRGATNAALDKMRRLVAEETGKVAGSLGLPPGMNLPGLS